MQTSVHPSIEHLQTLVAGLDKFKTTACASIGGVIKEAQITSKERGMFIYVYVLDSPEEDQPATKPKLDLDWVHAFSGKMDQFRADTITGAFEKIMQVLPGGTLLVPTITAEQDQIAEATSGLYKAAQAAWCAAFQTDPIECVDNVSAKNKRRQIREELKQAIKDEMWKDLTGGEEGIKRWNSGPRSYSQSISWEASQLSGAMLRNAQLSGLALGNCVFDKCEMEGADLHFSNISNATFIGARLERATLTGMRASGANFTGAYLMKADFEHSDLRICNFSNADLTAANLKQCNIAGVDFTLPASIEDAQFEMSTYDETTLLPEVFPQWCKLVWKGAGPDPYKQSVKQRAANITISEFDDLIHQLQISFDKNRLSKVFKMLKAERFQLFSEPAQDSVVGVVKSQTDADLVYACKLTVDGAYMCCTQNLKPCGGLRGALCKHILVLVIGLARAGKLDLTSALRWVLSSTVEMPALKKEIATDVFLKYKGWQAGEIDWRPTETIPEDYYAF